MRHRGNSSNSSIQHHSFLYSLPLPQRAEFIQSFIVSANATTLLGERAALDVAQRVCARYMSVVRPQHADVVVATSGGVGQQLEVRRAFGRRGQRARTHGDDGEAAVGVVPQGPAELVGGIVGRVSPRLPVVVILHVVVLVAVPPYAAQGEQ